MAIAEQVFGFYMPRVTLIGAGAHKEIPARIQALGGSRPLVVTDKGLTKVGITATITNMLKEANIEHAVYDETVPNPTDANVAAGLKIYHDNKCDSIISLGGGSSHDCAKGIGIVTTNGGSIHDYEGVDKSTKAMPPMLAVNTTAGTGAEMTRFCIITDLKRKVKMAIIDWRATPNTAIDDPILMMGMPPALTAATGMDALTHAIEAYVSTAATPMTDACAEKAINLIAKYLRKAVADGGDVLARTKMAHAQFLAGMAFNNASLGYVHAMAHQLGGFYDLPHGECNAVLLPHVCEFNLISKLERYADVAYIMNEFCEHSSPRANALRGIEAIRTLSADVGIPSGLKDLGQRYGKEVKEEDIGIMTSNAQKDACMLTNPRKATDHEVATIFTKAL